MKIVRVTGSYYPAKSMGGAATADFALDKQLASMGNEVSVLTTNAGLPEGFVGDYVYEGVKVKFFKYMFNPNFFISLSLFFYFLRNVIFTKSSAVVVFSGTWGFNSILLPQICLLFRVKYVVVPHGSLYPELMNRSILKRVLFKMFISRELRSSHFTYYTVENEASHHLSLHSSGNYLVAPLGLDLNETYSITKQEVLDFRRDMGCLDKVLVLYVGRITWKKKLELLVASLCHNPKATLVIIGPDDDGYLDLVYKQFTTKELDNIVYLGPKYYRDLAVAYQACDIYALTSISENFAMTVIEAAYYNSAILVTDRVGAADYFPDDSIVISSLDEKDINHKVNELVDSEAYRNTLKANAHQVAKDMTIVKLSLKFVGRIYE